MQFFPGLVVPVPKKGFGELSTAIYTSLSFTKAAKISTGSNGFVN